MSKRKRAAKRVEAYVSAAPEVRDHKGGVILSKKDAEKVRRARMERVRSQNVADQFGVGAW